MEIFHVLNRGVEKRTIVLDDKDRLRFLHDLYAFNDTDPTPNYILPGRHTVHRRTTLVYIHAFCLMPNHYHLLLSPAVENGISLFMQKLNMGYTKYFNEKYKRLGTLWQGKYKMIHIDREAHMLYIPYYIHLNPLDMSHPEWREGKVKNSKVALKKLRSYRWSSHLDYVGIRNFPSIIHRDFLKDILGSEKTYLSELSNIMSSPDIARQSSTIEAAN